jgi:serine/threonine protein kinase
MSISDPLTGTELDVYAVEERIGAGGMGAVYRARNLALDRPVALRVLRGERSSSRADAMRRQPERVQDFDTSRANERLFKNHAEMLE